MGNIDKRLADLGIILPVPAKPVANYVPWVRTGKLEYQGRLGDSVSLEDGVKSARFCAVNVLAQLREACSGNLDRVKRIVKLVGFVNATASFTEHPKVVNGASDLMVEIFGDKGRHARSAVGSPSLPFNLSVEVEAVAEIE
jgi:enamine deaminase RidA (YjgF/YER057c/UK114 family)